MTSQGDTAQPENNGIFADNALGYWRQGWTPMPAQGKTRILAGITGRDGRQPSMADIATWTLNHPNWNIAIRCSPELVGIDVDAYTSKNGAKTLAQAETQLGPLPPTWTTTSRDGTTSGIRWYRKPDPVEYKGIIQAAHADGTTTADIEIIQHHHRYAIAPPSIHPDTGLTYRWEHHNGTTAIAPPPVTDIPLLPPKWHEYLTAPPDPAQTHPPVQWEQQHANPENWHPNVTAAVQELAETVTTGNPGSRHDRALKATGRLCRHERMGYTGATSALAVCIDLFTEHMTDARGTATQANREIREMIATGLELVATTETLRIETDEIRELLNVDTFTNPEPDPDQPPEGNNPHLTNLKEWLDGTHQPTEPDWLTRNDNKAILYKQQLNWIHGDSGSGKTWVALIAAAQTIQNGGRIVWVHYEDPTPKTIIGRLKQLGIDDQTIIDRFHYWQPLSLGLTDRQHHQWLTATCAQLQPDMIILDSVGEALGADNLSEDKDVEVGPWLTKTLRHLVNLGHGVTGIDHMTKEGAKTDDLNPSGSKRKRAAITGHSVLVKAITPPTRTTPGRLALIAAKDRHGNYGRGQKVAEITLTHDNETTIYEIESPDADIDLTAERGERLVRAVVRETEKQPGIVLRDLAKTLPNASQQARGLAIEQAVTRGLIEEKQGARRAREFYPATQETTGI